MDNLTAKMTSTKGDVLWSTSTESPLTPEEEDTIVTLVIVVVAVLAMIVLLFSMGVFIDCRTQKTIEEKVKRSKRLRLKMPPLGRAHKQRLAHHHQHHREDSKCLASDMCPNGASDAAAAAAAATTSNSLEAMV